MFCERYSVVTFGGKAIYLIADCERIIHIDTKPPTPMGLLRSDEQPILYKATTELREYFSGQRQQLSFPTDMNFLPFAAAVYRSVTNIPYAAQRSYEDIAAAIGAPHHVKSVEMLCRCNPLCIYIPTHRVISASKPSSTFDEALRQMERRFASP